MRLIFINRFFYPDHSATSQILSDLAFALAQRGEQVTVVTSRLRYDDPEARLAPAEMINGVRVVRVWTSRFGRNTLLLRALDYATFYISSAWSLFKLAPRGDLVVAKTDPPMLGIASRYVARLHGAYFANWLQDIFPEVAVELGINSLPSRTVFFLARRLRNASVRKADLNIVIGNLMAKRLLDLGVRKETIRIIPNWTDTASIYPIAAAENTLRQSWQLQDKFVVGYSGNLGRAHEVATLLGAIETIQRDPSCLHIRFLFIGGGAQYTALEDACRYRKLHIVQFRPYQPRGKLAQSLSAADVHLVTLRQELEGLIVPSKFYGVAAAGRATIFIGDANGEIANLISERACGVTVQQGDSAKLAKEIMELAANPIECAAMGQNARAAAERLFGINWALEEWSDALGTLRRN